MRRSRAFVIGVLAALVPLGAAGAEPRTMVSVKFVLEAYPGQFGGARKPELEQAATAQIVGKLKEQIGFLDFTSTPGGEFALTVQLKPRSVPDRATAPHEVGFHFTLTGPGIQPGREYVMFRGEDDFNKIGNVAETVAEMSLRLTDDEYAGRIAQLLKKVPIARTAQVMRTPVAGWLLPYKRPDICMDFPSRLLIRSVVAMQGITSLSELEATAKKTFDPTAGPTTTPVEGSILSEPVDAAKFQQELGAVQPDQVTVSAVYVTELRALVPCTRP